MKNIPDEEFIDLRKIITQIVAKWYYFAITLFLCLAVAYVHLKTTPKEYEVQATLQLEDQSINENGMGRERFMGGLGLLSGNPQLADEIGVLSSYSMVRRVIQELDFTISYFQYPDTWLLGDQMEQEIYQSGFRVLLTEGHPQLVGVSVHVSFPDTSHYRVQVEADEANLLDLEQQKTIQEKLKVDIDEIVPLGEPFQSDLLSFRLFLDSGYVIQENQHYSFRVNSLNGLAQAYANKLEISPISDEASIVRLKTKGRVPEKEKDFINTLANMYIQYDLSKKNQLGLRAIEFIDSQLSTVYDSLQLVEGSLESFRASNQIINISTTSQNLNEQLQELEAEQAQLKVQQQYYQYTSDYLRNNEEITDVVAPSSVGITDPLLNNLLQELSAMSQEKVEKAYSSGANNPVLRVLEGKIRNTKAALIENMDNLINSNSIAIQENQRRINRLEAQLNRLPESERNLIAIERKFTLNDNIYNYLLEKRAEAGIAIASNLPDKSVIDEARVMGSGPVAPKRTNVLVLALLAGIGIPIAFIWGRNFFNNKITDKSDLESIEDIPLVGLIPRAAKNQLLATPGTPLAEAFRFLRLQLEQYHTGTEYTAPKIIGVTSAQQGDGKTFCAVNLAIAYTRGHKKTLLVGADLRNPRLHDYLPVESNGLADFLTDKLSLSELIKESDRMPGLYMLSSGRTNVDAGMLLESNRFATFIEYVNDHFDTIILDAPPLGLVADYQSISRYVSLNLFIVRQNRTEANILKGSIKKISKTNPTAMILNDAQRYVLSEYGHYYSKNGYYASPVSSR